MAHLGRCACLVIAPLNVVLGCSAGVRDDAPSRDASPIEDQSASRSLDEGQIDADLPLAGPPVGQRIAEGQYFVWGLTAGHDVIVSNWSSSEMSAVSLVDGSMVKIPVHSTNGWFYPEIQHDVLLLWDGVESNVGPLWAWTRKSGLVKLSDRSLANNARVSRDSKFVLFSDAIPKSLDRVAVVVSTTDGQRKFVVSQESPLSPDCVPTGGFFEHRGILSFCHDLPPELGDSGVEDGGADDAAVSHGSRRQVVTLDVDVGEAMVLRDGISMFPFSIDELAARILLADETGQGWLLSLDEGPIAMEKRIVDGLILPGGAAAVYLTGDGDLKRWACDGLSAPVTLVARTVGALAILRDVLHPGDIAPRPFVPSGVSTDGAWLFWSSTPQLPDGSWSDLYVSSTRQPGLVRLAAKGRAALLGDAFTADSLYALFVSDTALEGSFPSRPVAVGRPTVLDLRSGDSHELAEKGRFLWSGSASQIVFSEHFRDLAELASSGQVDVRRTHLGVDAGTDTLALAAESEYAVDKELAKVVFSIAYGDFAGIYVQDLN